MAAWLLPMHMALALASVLEQRVAVVVVAVNGACWCLGRAPSNNSAHY